ncbi:AP-5 complex subunit mu [Asimina triloba]
MWRPSSDGAEARSDDFCLFRTPCRLRNVWFPFECPVQCLRGFCLTVSTIRACKAGADLTDISVSQWKMRFPVVEKRWRLACERESKNSNEDNLGYAVLPLLPADLELASAFAERKKSLRWLKLVENRKGKEALDVYAIANRTIDGSARGFGIRVTQSAHGSDSWVDDPITRHIISLRINKEGEGESFLLWPLVLHIKGVYNILLLPLVEPHHLKAYESLCERSDCGNSVGEQDSLSSLLVDLPCITGYGSVLKAAVPFSSWMNVAVGDVITGDFIEPEVVTISSSVGGLLDSLTGSIGISSISARAKPVAAPVAASSPSATVVTGATVSDAPKSLLKPIDKDALRTFISSSMPFGTPLDLNYSNISAIKINGFSSLDFPPPDLKQPAWKPYLFKGKQRIQFMIHESIYAAMYDRDEIPDVISISGQVNCRAELEGLPDVSFPLTGLNTAHIEVLSFHPCAQVPEHGVDKQAVMFSPPLGNFVLMRYQAFSGLGPPIKGFYQLSMVSEDEGAFLFKLRLMEGYKAPLTMEFCTVTMPFPRRRVVFLDGNPSIGTVTTTEHSVEWKIIVSSRGVTGKSIEATFPGTIRFAPKTIQRSISRSLQGGIPEEDSDIEAENSNNMAIVEDFLMEKMNKDLPSVDLEEPFCWQAYNHAKVAFKIVGGTLSGMLIDPKSVSIYPSVKALVEFSMQASSGDYILEDRICLGGQFSHNA